MKRTNALFGGLIAALVLGCHSAPNSKSAKQAVDQWDYITYDREHWSITLPSSFVVIAEEEAKIKAANTGTSDVGVLFVSEPIDLDLDLYVTMLSANLVSTDGIADMHGITWAGHDGIYFYANKDDKQIYFWHTVVHSRLYKFGCAGSKDSTTVKSECESIAASVVIKDPVVLGPTLFRANR